MTYEGHAFPRPVTVDRLYSLHCDKYARNDLFPGESHPFCELIWVVRGSCALLTDNCAVKLTRGQGILVSPDNLHCLWGDREPFVFFVTAFSSPSDALAEIFDRPLWFSDALQRAFFAYCREAAGLFPREKHAARGKTDGPPFAQGQLALMALERFLIDLLRENREHASEVPHKGMPAARLVNGVCRYLAENRERPLTLDQVARDNAVSKSHLSAVFQEQMGRGVMRYFQELKIASARLFLEQGRYNCTEVAQRLGFSSLHTFSRAFKRVEGIAPEYYLRGAGGRS